ncbi:MAG: XTP/dITP diphosphatase [Erysipelotrichia bacterium]|nr:XTP/dITP diphosphatase [Erysipelotrichia bacterium]
MTEKEKVIVIASTNQRKIREFKEMLEPKGYAIKTFADLQTLPETEETGTTFRENAILKAQAVTDQLHIEAIADDSGLEIDAFDRAPGIYSARYLGKDTPYDYKNKVILDRLKGNTNRSCRYVCAIAFTRPDAEPEVFQDTAEGMIAEVPSGSNGFGYDPIVFYPPLGKTMAEMSDTEKNQISHRGKALAKLEKWLNEKR